jgi:hypothetical protein
MGKKKKQTNKQRKGEEKQYSKSEKKTRTPRLQWLSDAPGRQQGG